jgi:hypothetical protein
MGIWSSLINKTLSNSYIKGKSYIGVIIMEEIRKICTECKTCEATYLEGVFCEQCWRDFLNGDHAKGKEE